MFGLLLVHSCGTGPVWCEGLDCWLWKNGIFLKNRNKFDVFSAFAHFLTVYIVTHQLLYRWMILWSITITCYSIMYPLLFVPFPRDLVIFRWRTVGFFFATAGDWSMPWATYLEALGSASHQDSHHHISVKDSKFDFSYSHTHWLIHHTHTYCYFQVWFIILILLLKKNTSVQIAQNLWFCWLLMGLILPIYPLPISIPTAHRPLQPGSDCRCGP